jgi:thiamine pyrophosphate-dependent acetolactate synthase large subunit-like protein
VAAVHVDTCAELDAALERAFAARAPLLIDVNLAAPGSAGDA